jgi:hypothetical protein
MKLEKISVVLKAKDVVIRHGTPVGRFRQAIVVSSENTLEQMFWSDEHVQPAVTLRLQWLEWFRVGCYSETSTYHRHALPTT